MIDGESLNEDEKDDASLYFISLYERLFYNFCSKKNLVKQDVLSDGDLYFFSPTEISANKYALSIASRLGNADNYENYQYFLSLLIIEQLSIAAGEDKYIEMIDKVIKRNLRVTINFLKYKNEHSGLKAKYLDIDEKELARRINRARKKELEKERLLDNIVNKLHNK